MTLDSQPATDCRPVPGYDGDYAVCSDGTVWSMKSGQWQQKATWLEHGHETVALFRLGERTRRRVTVLVREAFGDDRQGGTNDDKLRWYLRHQYGLDDNELTALFEQEKTDERSQEK